MSVPRRRVDTTIWIGLAGIGLGAAVLLVYAWVEFLNHPGISLVDGYWIGRVPWTPAGVLLVIGGASLAVAAGAFRILVWGDWVRWLLLIPVLGAPALWWLFALRVVPVPRYSAVDPVTLAYSAPQGAALFLVVPAVAAAVLAFLPMQPDRRVRRRRVHPPGTPPPPRDEG